MDNFGPDVSSHIFQKIFSEIVWVKTDPSNKTILCFPDMSSRAIRFLGEVCNQKSQKSEFETFIADIVQNINIEAKLPFEFKLQISKNIFDFLIIISRIEVTQQLVLALGFALSGISLFNIIGKEFMVNKYFEMASEKTIKKIPYDIIEKSYFFLIHSKGEIDILESDVNKEESLTGNTSTSNVDNTNQVSNFNVLDEVTKAISQVISSQESSSPEKTKPSTDKDKNNNNENTKLSESINFTPCREIKSEKLAFELGPSAMVLKKESFSRTKNKSGNLVVENPAYSLYDFNLTEKRLAEIIIFIMNNFVYSEEKEQRLLLKLFFKNINNDIAQQIEENTEKKINLNWNLDLIFKTYKTSIESLNYETLFSHLDDPQFNLSDKKVFEAFLIILSKLKIPNLLFKTVFCNGAWKNIDNQLSTISFILNNPNDLVKSSSNRQIKRNSNIIYDYSHLKNSQLNAYLIEVWSNLDVVSGLLKIASGEYMFKVKSIFDWPINHIAETVLLALMQLPSDNFLHKELLKEVFPIFLGSHVNSIPVLEDLWSLDQNRFIEVLNFLYTTIPETVNMNKILDLTQKIKDCLIPLVSSNNDYFSICLATLAIKRDFLHVDQWLNDRIEKRGDYFILPLLSFIKLNVIQEYKKKIEGNSNYSIKTSLIKQNKYSSLVSSANNQGIQGSQNLNPGNEGRNNSSFAALKDQILEKSQLTIEAIAIIFEHLSYNTMQLNQKVTKPTLLEISHVYKQIFEIFDELHSHPPSSVETEEKANLLFRKLFNDETSIKSLTEQMKVYKESSNKKDNEVFACMLHSMLDEYRFFIKYPDKELILMGCLFGQIIDLRLIDGVIESIALKYIIEGFKKQQSKLIIFSTKAVEQFIEKILSWPLFLEELYKATRNYSGPLYDRIAEKNNEYLKITENLGVTHNPVIGASQTNFNMNTNPNNNNSNPSQNQIPGKGVNMQGIGGFMGMIPPSNIPKSQTKNNKFNTPSEHMGINNISGSNQNFQNMYPNMYGNMNNNMTPSSYIPAEKTQLNANQMPFNPSSMNSKQGSKVGKELNYTTNITLIKKVYTSDLKFKESPSSQINALKNLAISLSQVTIQKNKPLLSKDINLKSMILEAFVSGKLLIAVSFVCKYLEQTTKSKIFHNKNPWVTSLLSMLTELYRHQLVAQNIKTEIEDLFKKLELDIVGFQASSNTEKLKVPKNSTDFINQSETLKAGASISVMEAKIEEILSLFQAYKIENQINDLCENIKTQINSKELEKQIKSNNDMPQNFCSKENMTQILAKALLNAINQILFLVVERTVNISLTTTRELVIKDFAFDPDVEKFKKAVILSVKSLSGSLANVTCKDPLRQGFINQIKEQLNKAKMDLIIEMVKSHASISRIIELGCFYIKEYVVAKSVEKADKDELLLEEYSKRESGNFLKNTSKDSNSVQQKMLSLPPFLLPSNIVGVVPDPIKIYEDFEKLSVTKE